MVDKYKSGKKDVSEKHDDYLEKIFKEMVESSIKVFFINISTAFLL